MGRRSTRDTKYSNFILRVINTHHKVSSSAHEPQHRGDYYLNFKIDSITCEAIPPSDKLELPLYLDIACDDRPKVTPKDIQTKAEAELRGEDFDTYQKYEKARDKLMESYRPLGIGYINKHNGVMRGYISLEQHVWLASHILLCSGKPCFVSLIVFRKPRQRDYLVNYFSVSTEQEE